jgi:hypothetical protein
MNYLWCRNGESRDMDDAFSSEIAPKDWCTCQLGQGQGLNEKIPTFPYNFVKLEGQKEYI